MPTPERLAYLRGRYQARRKAAARSAYNRRAARS